MKKLFFKYLFPFYLLFLFSSFTSYNTSVCYWVGGTIGAETDWNNPRNWSQNKVPDWTVDCVIIPNVSTRSNHFPIINTETEAIPHLQIQGGANLQVNHQGQLIIDGSSNFNYGIVNVGKISNKGKILVKNTGLLNILDLGGVIENEGILVLDDELKAQASEK